MAQYLPILTMIVLVVIFVAASFAASKLLTTKRPTKAKTAPYECGIVSEEGPAERFPVRFYLVAMIFIIFDIEIIFLYPYAIIYRGLGPFGLGELVAFSVPVFASFLYLIANGALDWGPLQTVRRLVDHAMVSSDRTSVTTVRRVGLEGRITDDEAAA